jgi:hypothetical protein
VAPTSRGNRGNEGDDVCDALWFFCTAYLPAGCSPVLFGLFRLTSGDGNHHYVVMLLCNGGTA